MTFNIDNARKIVTHYTYLVGQPIASIENKALITNIAIMPVDKTNITKFLTTLYNTGDNDSALTASGFDKSNVEIFVLSKQPKIVSFIKKELDEFLTSKNIDKIYLNEDWLSQ